MRYVSQGSISLSAHHWLKTCLDLAPRNPEICRFFLRKLHFYLPVKQLMTDSIYAMNGKSVEVDNTDAEGRLVLSGLIPFFSDISWLLIFFPQMLFTTQRRNINLTLWSTLQHLPGKYSYHAIKTYKWIYLNSSAMVIALGEAFSGVFSVRFCFSPTLFDWFR